jgi:ABC-type uncharacterized transport system auxiliary subunit
MNKFYGLALLGLFMAGCLSPRPIVPITLYSLDPPITVPVTGSSALTLGMRPLEAVEPYRKKMAFLSGEHALGFRHMEEWAEPPEQVVTRALTDAIAGAGYFIDAGNAVNMAHPDLMLTGTIRKYYEDRTSTPATATLEVGLELRKARGADQLFSEILRIREPMQGDTAADFARAMDTAISKLASTAAERIVAAAARDAATVPTP